MSDYVYQPEARMDFATAVQMLRNCGRQVVERGIDNASPAVIAAIRAAASVAGLPLTPYRINIADYRQYVHRAGYPTRYRDYYPGNQLEKSLEHYLAYRLLDLQPDDVFVDLASEYSPVPEIYQRLTGAQVYAQDIMYPEGLHGRHLGSDAAAMPVPDGFFSKATLTCSLEHFEQDADSRLFQELARVLRPGGMICVAPFYLYAEAATQTDPTLAVPANVPFDPDQVLYCAEGWGNRHGRFYSPASFLERIGHRFEPDFAFNAYHLINAHYRLFSAHPDHIPVYARFVFTATRR